MSYPEPRTQPTWQEQLKYYAKLGLTVVVAIWIFNIANGANQVATENATLLQVPEYQLSLVPGGPERFTSVFEDANGEREDGAIQAEEYLWSSVVVTNTGHVDAEDLTVNITGALPISHVLISAPGWGNDVEVDHQTGESEASVSLDELDTGDEAIVFIAMAPSGWSKPYDTASAHDWATTFDTSFAKITVESDQAEATLYARGYGALYQ